MSQHYKFGLQDILKILGLAAVYALAAKCSLDYFSTNGTVSIIWPPSGISFAAVLIGGQRYAAAVFLGVILGAFTGNIPIWAVAGIGIGNTMEALVGAYFLKQNDNQIFSIRSLQDYLRLIFYAGCIGCIIAAFIGTSALVLSGLLSFEVYLQKMIRWWMGDMLGILLFTPLILVWMQPKNGRFEAKHLPNILLIMGSTFLAGQIVFLDWFHNIFAPFAKAYWMFLFVTWAAIQLKTRGVVIVLMLIALQGLWSAYHGIGYFSNGIADRQLSNYWVFIVILSLVGMVIAAHFTGLKHSEDALLEKEILLSESQRIAHVGSWVLDLATYKLIWTDETYCIYGVSLKTFIPSIESLQKLIHADDQPKLQTWIETCLAGGQPDELEFRTIRPDGTLRFIFGRGDLQFDVHNKAINMLGTFQDITERKEAEAKILRLSQLYAALSQCNQSIVHCTSEEELFPEICRDAVNFGGMKMAWIGLTDPETKMVKVIASFGDNLQYLQEKQISTDANSPLGLGPTGKAIRENVPYWCQDYINDPATEPWHEFAKRLGWRSSAVLPICRNGKPVGSFNLYSGELNAFDEAVRHLLVEMAVDISFALDNYQREAKRLESEKALKKSEHYLRTVIETEPECVKVVDQNGELKDMNQAGLAMFEAESVSELQQKTLVECIAPEYRSDFIALHKNVLKGEKQIFEYEIIGLRGSRRWLETHAAPLRDESGEITMILGVSRDVTLKKQTEKALLDSEQRLALVIKGSHDAPWDWDIVKKQAYYSPQWWQMLGYQEGEFPGDEKTLLSLLHPNDLKPFNEGLDEALLNGQNSVNFEFRLRHKNGHYVPVLSRGFISRDKSGKPLRVSGTNMDLTERYRGQELEDLRLCLLELLMSELPIQAILDNIVRKLESLNTESLCSILLVDKEGKLWRGAAPNLPDFYNTAIEGLLSGVGVGSCGNAIATGQRTIVEDIASHLFWSSFKDIAGKAGLAACWSEPIYSSGNKVLGAIAIYSRRPASPSVHEIKMIEMAAHFTAIAIERKRAEADLNLAAKVFDQSHEGFLITNARRKIIKVNKAFSTITGYTEEEALGKPSNMLSSGHHEESFYQEMWASIQEKGYWQGEVWSRRKNGDIYPELLNIGLVRDSNGKITEYIGVFADITQIKSSERHLEFLAHHDSLTSLPNRLLLFSRLEHGIDVAKREHKQLALLMLDLDRFKDVNDSLGHLSGDQLLKLVADRLTGRLRDIDTVARLGGDEFTVLLEDIAHPEDAARLAESIIADFSAPWFLPNGAEVRIGVSIGISLYPQFGDTPEILLQQADTALYQAKGAGRNRFAYFSDELTFAVLERIAVEGRLRRAIAQEELKVYYQPQINIGTGKIIGAEALVRWFDPVDGLIPPTKFIPIAEHTGLIKAIGDWVLRETCRQGKNWIDAGYPPLTLAVNVSPYQFRQGNLETTVATVLKETGFPAEYLELEFTESGLMERNEDAVRLLNGLRSQGIRLAIDDFGTGYSSLAYLKQFPLDVLKIDKGFIDEIPDSLDDMEIAATIVAMGHTLGFKVLAEGIEAEEQLAFLKEKGCDYFQGYLCSRPLPAAEFCEFLNKSA